jgi:isopentenyl diphosphate isomerase/L-lactate dehydrogenase-like FMN-dependent dehydrogenase
MSKQVQFTNLLQLESLARELLEPSYFDYIAGGADDELTIRRNREDFERIVLRPRMLVDVSEVSTSTTVLGTPISLPVMLAPTAGHKMCCPDGEMATARAASAMGTVMVLSTLSTTSLEDVASAAPGPKWFQLYVYKDREVTRTLVQRAEAAGYRALCVTVDVPLIGNRERDLRNAFTFPYPLPNFAGFEQAGLEKLPIGVVNVQSGLGAYIASKWDPSLSWKDIEWFRSITRLPMVIKGVLTAEDAVLAADHGASAVVVSNHGGRQLDSVPSGIAALPEVAEAVGDRLEIYMDGGVRRGTDVLKALALGARAVLIGRPYMYALAVGGEEGVRRALEILRQEISRAMALSGRPAVSTIDRSLVAYHDRR